MAPLTQKQMIELGVKVADMAMHREDKIWSRYSNDKVDIGEELMKVIRTLNKEFPIGKNMRALSIGSSAEPQFRILETAFTGGLYLFDVDEGAIGIIKERVMRQHTRHVTAVLGDYKNILLDRRRTKKFIETRLSGNKMDLISLHHSLYYCEEKNWHTIFENLYREVLARKGAIHAVLMSAESDDPRSTTWLYNYFVGRYFGCRNNQDLLKFKKELEDKPLFKKAGIFSRSNNVRFFVNDFEKMMAVVWMILLYPNVHKYTPEEREEITGFVYKKFWLPQKPLVQCQDHMVIYKNIGIRGLI